MLNVEDNTMLTETDPRTPMGTLLRRFWLPAMLSEEVPGADCPPVRLRLLGENLVGFRDSNGTVGILEAYCPHRSFPIQDLAMIEDQWGPIAKRSLEHLVSSDEAIIRVRRNILQAVQDLLQGIEPPLVQNLEISRVFPVRMVLPPDADVAEALRPHMGPTASG